MKKLVLAAMLGLAATTSHASAFTLGNLFKNDTAKSDQASQQRQQSRQPLVLAQSSGDSVRIQQLEETIRQLNGRVEEMSFQLLQMQEQMRKTQQDNEFRFQELEKGSAGGASAPAVAAAPAAGSKKNDEIANIIDQPGTPAVQSLPQALRLRTVRLHRPLHLVKPRSVLLRSTRVGSRLARM